jgi:molybdenum cofactor cytidylyltransferase
VSRIAAAILAAGSSSRLGTPKQLLDLDGQPVLTHTLAAVRRSSTDPVLVVLGHERARIAQSVDLSQIMVVENPDYASGQSTSMQVAVRSLPEDVEAVVFVLGDQPLVDPSVIDALVGSRQTNGAPIIQPRYAEGRGNPVLIGREMFEELLEITGDTGARPLLERNRDRLVLVDVSNKRRPDDIDTMDDYVALKAQYASLRKRGT